MNALSQLDQAESPHTQPDPKDVSRQLPPANNPASIPQDPAPAKRSLSVLCIDDDEMILETLRDCLALFGHRVKVASGGRCGIETFHTAILKSEPYDVVIIDLRMPDLDGYEVARQIKAESPDTPLIMMSGYGASKEQAKLMCAPVDVVLNKPPRIHELNDLLLRMAR